MKLTFESDSELIIRLAQKCAKAFCRQVNNASLFDDAQNDAILLLLEYEFDTFYSPEQINAYLKKRVVGKLIRNYQTVTGSRRKHKRERVDEADVEDTSRKVDSSTNDIIRRALVRSSAFKQLVISDYLEGWKQKDIAKKYGLSRGRISQIIGTFKRCARFIDEYGCTVAIVNTLEMTPSEKERAKFPLFYEIQD